MDAYKKVGLRPFLELGLWPKKLASGSQTIFYWQGNTTPPKDYDMWCNMVHSLLRHLMGRYGEEEVIQWPIEVWNEPIFAASGKMRICRNILSCSIEPLMP